MNCWNSAQCLDKLATYATLATIVAPFLFGIVALVAQHRSKQLEATQADKLAAEHGAELERVRSDAEATARELKGALEIVQRGGAEAAQVITRRLEGAQAELEKSRSKIKQIENTVAPRVIDDEHRKKLIGELRSCNDGRVSITTVLGDGEAMTFANQLDDAFKVAGWQSSGVSQAVFTGVPMGLILRVPSREAFHKCTLVVQQAFREIGYEAPGEVVANTSVDAVDLVVGKKP